MNMRDLIPWGRTQQTPSRYREEGDPFMTLHREMNRLFDDVFRGFDLAPFGGAGRVAGWPSVEATRRCAFAPNFRVSTRRMWKC
jgi:HSP20 family protein